MTSDYGSVEREIRDAFAAPISTMDAMRRVVEILKARVPAYTWVGIYRLIGDELVLGPFLGTPSPHTRIPLGRGICGAAATERSTIIVDNVHSDPRYLACSIEIILEGCGWVSRRRRQSYRDAFQLMLALEELDNLIVACRLMPGARYEH